MQSDNDGGVLGGQIGAQYQFGAIVAGIEADWSWADSHGASSCANSAFSCHTSIDHQASVRGRLGVAWKRALFYGTAGWAWAEVEGYTQIPPTGATFFRDSSDRSGFIWGFGVQGAFSDNVIVGLEYLQADFGTKTHLYDVPYRVPMETQVIRARLDFKFGGPRYYEPMK